MSLQPDLGHSSQRGSNDPRATLLLVDDEPANLELLERTLRHEGSILTAASGEEAMSTIDRADIDLLISDQRMPRITGVRVAEHLQVRNPLAVRILLTGYTDTADLLDAINRGEVYRYLTKPWDPTDLLVTVRRALEAYELRRQRARMIDELAAKNAALSERLRQVRLLNESLERRIAERTQALAEVNLRLAAAVGELSAVAQSDPMTGLWNARAIRQETHREIIRSRRFGRSFSLLYVDIDDFRGFNQRHGSVVGDRALRTVAGWLLGALKHTDAIARYGPEEFVALVPHADRESGRALAEQLRSSIAQEGVPGETGRSLGLSVSIGVVAFPESGPDVDALLRAAQLAAQEACRQGGNRIA